MTFWDWFIRPFAEMAAVIAIVAGIVLVVFLFVIAAAIGEKISGGKK